MKHLIATTALALIIGGPAVAQATDQQTDQQAGQDQQQQVQAQDQQQVGDDQQMMAEGGFYQPQANDLFISELMDAQVYAPAAGDTGMQQDAAAQQEGDQAVAAEGDAGAEVEVTVEDAEGDTATETVTTEGDADDQQVAQEPTAEETEMQQAETADDAEMQQAEAGQEGTQPGQQVGAAQTEQQQMGTQQFQERQVTQDELQNMENIGSVSDIVVNQQGEIQAIVLDVGGFLGIGAREVALSMDQVEFGRDADDPDSFVLISNVSADQLENAPEFDRAQLEQDRDWAQAGTQPQEGEVQQQLDTAAATGPEGQQAWRGDRQAMTAPQMEREGFQQAEAAEVTADNLLGANVYDINDDNIGSVSDIVMGANGQAEYAVIDVGGFLGFGTHTVAIGFDEMQILHDDGWSDLRVYVDVTQEELENMPEYEQN